MAVPVLSAAQRVVPTMPRNGSMTAMGPAQLNAAVQAESQRLQESQTISPQMQTGIAGMIQRDWEIFSSHRNSQSGWSERLLEAQRAFTGQYSPKKLQEIQQFGGSEIYSRLIAQKCRGASSLLRDVYLTQDRPWGLDPPADPDIDPQMLTSLATMMQAEVQNLLGAGQPVDDDAVRDRTMGLMTELRLAAKKKAAERCRVAEDKIDELLWEGGFYSALAEFLVDLPLYPFACLKGPVVRITNQIEWLPGGVPNEVARPRLYWERVAPFDIWWSPGVADIRNATVIHRLRYTRAELNDLLDLPGYNHQNVRTVLDEYGRGGLTENWDYTDTSRAVMESRENPVWNRTGLITCHEWHGNVQGRTLLEEGMNPALIRDPMRDYKIQAWKIGRYIIKFQLSPSPRKRHSFYITSFEKIPGTPVGNGLTDILADIQDLANAALRSLCNNMAIASGPQVTVNDDLLAPGEDGETIFPWKRWHVVRDPMASGASTQRPVDFYQPQDNSQALMNVYQLALTLGDDASAIPRYIQGGSPGAGAGRTASGLAMLMGNASKTLQTVAANVDTDIFEEGLQEMVSMLLLTDTTDLLDGTEDVVVKGVNVAIQRETMRQRQLEFLQITANPIDAQIMGPKGRAAVLRSVSHTVGMPGEDIVPSEEQLDAQQAQAASLAAQTGQPGFTQQPPEGAAPGGAAQGNQPPPASGDMGPRLNTVGNGVPRRSVGAGVQ